MTATLDAVTRKKAKPEPSAEQKLAEEPVSRARELGVSLTGPDGLLKQLTGPLRPLRRLAVVRRTPAQVLAADRDLRGHKVFVTDKRPYRRKPLRWLPDGKGSLKTGMSS